MNTFERYRKFGLEYKGMVGLILTAVGSGITLLGLAVLIVDMCSDSFGLEGAILAGFMVIFFGGGIGLAFAGVRTFLKDKKRVNGLLEAYEKGEYFMADITDVKAYTSSEKTGDNMFTGVSYREYYLVECRYKDPATGVTHIYHSRPLYYDPTELIVKKQVPVYVDKNNEKSFFVDIDKALAPVEVH